MKRTSYGSPSRIGSTDLTISSNAGEQRLEIALDLHTLALDVAREGIRRQFPNADVEEVDKRLRKRLELLRE